MKNNGMGGMRTSGENYTIYCPVCGKPAARKESTDKGEKYMHFTKTKSVWHETEVRNEAD